VHAKAIRRVDNADRNYFFIYVEARAEREKGRDKKRKIEGEGERAKERDNAQHSGFIHYKTTLQMSAMR